MSSFVRLFIVQARDAQAQYFLERDLCEAKDYLPTESGCLHSQVWSLDDGLAVALLTSWDSHEAATQFHFSGLNTLLTAVTQRHIAGSPTLRVFRIIC